MKNRKSQQKNRSYEKQSNRDYRTEKIIEKAHMKSLILECR